jgi:two-component system sensor histidine kinase GlrK
MKVSTKIIAGYGVLIFLTLAVLLYQGWVIQQLDTINSKLSELNIRYALSDIDLQYKERRLEEFAKKYYEIGDPIYKLLFWDAGTDLETILKKLRSESISEPELKAIDRLTQTLKEVQTLIYAQPEGRQNRDVSVELQDQLELLRVESDLVLKATQVAIQDAAAQSKGTAAHAVRVSWIAAAAALLLSILVSVPIVWSIVTRLNELGRATNVVAQGKFEHRMPASGNDEFASLARDFNTMARKLGELDQLKKDFVSHVSHDLKGPLASTQETVNLMLAGIPGPLNEKQRRLLGLCLKSSVRLSGMIGNLLDVSKMEAGMMEYKFESCDVVPLVSGVVSEFEGLAHEKKLELFVEPSVPEIPVDCDPGRLTQVLANLIENAIKFSPESNRITVRIHANGAYSTVSVIDRGPGIPLESRSRIFDRFHQVSPGRKIAGQGVGLGLAICKIIIEAHGGSIWVENNPEGGSIFQFKVRSSARDRA